MVVPQHYTFLTALTRVQMIIIQTNILGLSSIFVPQVSTLLSTFPHVHQDSFAHLVLILRGGLFFSH